MQFLTLGHIKPTSFFKFKSDWLMFMIQQILLQGNWEKLQYGPYNSFHTNISAILHKDISVILKNGLLKAKSSSIFFLFGWSHFV